jgi:asparagine synthase (glutamine-hydrolysing)
VTRIEAVSARLKAALYSDSFLDIARSVDARSFVRSAIAASDGTSLAERCAHADTTTYLPDDILVKVDVASMAHGLECRAPLLDHVLAEYVASLPFPFKIDGAHRKVILKHALRGRLPGESLRRRKKGFSIPLQRWFQGQMDSVLRDTLLSPTALAHDYFQRAAIEQLISEHQAGLANHQASLFAMLMLESWHGQWIDRT